MYVFKISELEISYHINMINKEFHYALGFIIFVSLFMWFHVISHQNITNMHVVHYLAKLVQKNVSTKYFEKNLHPKLDLVNFAVRPLLFTKSCSSLNWICSKNEIGWNYSELKDINLKYILSKDSLRFININLPMFCNFQTFSKKFQTSRKISSKLPKYCKISIIFVH